MHKSGKVLMIIGGVICLGGIVGFAGAGAAVDPGTSNKFSGTSGTFYNEDLFYSVYTMGGTCEDITVTLTNVETGATSEEFVAPEGYFRKDCGAGASDSDIGDYKYVGYVEPLSEIGNYTVDASTTIYITDDAEAVGGALAGLGIGMIAFCCGGGFLLLGLILGLTIKDNKHTAVIMQQPGMVGMQQPMMAQQGVAPMMAQPQVTLPTTSIGQLAPQAAATGAANPAAMNYYQGLIQQGYDAQTALMHTAQHFPGWQP